MSTRVLPNFLGQFAAPVGARFLASRARNPQDAGKWSIPSFGQSLFQTSTPEVLG